MPVMGGQRGVVARGLQCQLWVAVWKKGGRAGGEGFDASYGRTTSGTTTVAMG